MRETARWEIVIDGKDKALGGSEGEYLKPQVRYMPGSFSF